MMRQLTWRNMLTHGGVVLGAWLLCLIVLVPATFIDVGLRHATTGRVRLAQAHGTLWSGSGRLELRDPRGPGGVGMDLAWTLQVRALLRGQLDYMLTLGQAATRFPLHVSARRVEFANVEFSLPARALGIAVPRIAPLDLRGELRFHIAKFARAAGVATAAATVTWQDAGSALTPVAPLGSYVLRLDAADGSASATLGSRSGPLRLDGHGTRRGNGPWVLSATARIDATHRAQLAPLLRLVAIDRGNGEFALQFTSPLGGVPAATR